MACALHCIGRAKSEADIMAEQPNDDTETEAAKPKRGKFIVICLLGMFVLAGATAGGLYYAGVFTAKASETAEPGKPPPEPPKEAIYVSSAPCIHRELREEGRREISTGVRRGDDQGTGGGESSSRRTCPRSETTCLMLFSARSSDSLTTPEGKKQLQAETLSAVQEILVRESGERGRGSRVLHQLCDGIAVRE